MENYSEGVESRARARLTRSKPVVGKATVMQMIQGAENLPSICARLTATCLTLVS